MAATRPIYLQAIIFACQLLAKIIASAHFLLYKIGFFHLSKIVVNTPTGVLKTLERIWFVRFLKRVISVLVRTPLRKHVLQLIDFDQDRISPGSIVVSCHTPWARLLTQWCVENNYAMIVGWGPWTKRASIARHATGFNDLRGLCKHLCSGGRIVIMADIFNDLNNCPVRFFEKPCNASLFPLRLANIANTTLVTVVPALKNETVQIHIGPQVSSSGYKAEPGKIMQTFLSYFENEIKEDPTVWSGYIRGSLAKEL